MAVRVVIETVREFDVAGIVNAVTFGGVASGSVMVTEALRLVETLLAASFAHA